eukprot:CAMPEP_0195079480 /NCGR_PEP_ID=MMETSP0448-20130528/21380_1 /TAXON_ID=66468 /ORGANISM="Heterocapsa triquestra, Strain CCMP 448" /LENGTH=778 /DNA_ID=CAMNT_0040112313 /DNA_START=1 /DNA_END=2333 /DNA_ORIENTATION=-
MRPSAVMTSASRAQSFCIVHPGSVLNDGRIRLGARQVHVASDARGEETLSFDRVFEAHTSQEVVFEEVARAPLLDVVARLTSCAFIAFGASGGGKSFAITGGVQRFADRGLIPRGVSALFEALSARADRADYEVSVSFYEVYKDNVLDLLASNRGQAVVAPGMEAMRAIRRRVLAESDAYHLLFQGDANRHFERLPLNHETSRGHVFYVVHVGHLPSRREASACFADLAAVVALRDHATSSVARGLDALRSVVEALHAGAAADFEASQLTRQLQEWLQPRVEQARVALLTPLRWNEAQLEENCAWLGFAQVAREALQGGHAAHQAPAGQEPEDRAWDASLGWPGQWPSTAFPCDFVGHTPAPAASEAGCRSTAASTAFSVSAGAGRDAVRGPFGACARALRAADEAEPPWMFGLEPMGGPAAAPAPEARAEEPELAPSQWARAGMLDGSFGVRGGARQEDQDPGRVEVHTHERCSTPPPKMRNPLVEEPGDDTSSEGCCGNRRESIRMPPLPLSSITASCTAAMALASTPPLPAALEGIDTATSTSSWQPTTPPRQAAMRWGSPELPSSTSQVFLAQGGLKPLSLQPPPVPCMDAKLPLAQPWPEAPVRSVSQQLLLMPRASSPQLHVAHRRRVATPPRAASPSLAHLARPIHAGASTPPIVVERGPLRSMSPQRLPFAASPMVGARTVVVAQSAAAPACMVTQSMAMPPGIAQSLAASPGVISRSVAVPPGSTAHSAAVAPAVATAVAPTPATEAHAVAVQPRAAASEEELLLPHLP